MVNEMKDVTLGSGEGVCIGIEGAGDGEEAWSSLPLLARAQPKRNSRASHRRLLEWLDFVCLQNIQMVLHTNERTIHFFLSSSSNT